MKKLFIILSAIVLLAGCGKSSDITDTDTVQTPAETETALDNRASMDDSADEEAEDYFVPQSERVVTLPDPETVSQDQTVTMMIYMVGSDLESKAGAATNDMQEMIDSSVDLSKVNIVVYAGGSTQWFSDISEEKNSLLQLTDKGFDLITEYPSKSMGDPSCLTQFLKYCYSNYKTDSYNLVLWDHGNGPILGYGKDKIYDGDSMTLPELKKALADSPFNSDNKLGFIGFDACLMSSAELACTVADYSDFLIASQEVEPNFGWNYAFLEQCGKVDNASLAKLVAFNYVSFCDDYFNEHDNFCNDVTMACIDLRYASELEDSINALFDKVSDDVSGGYSKLAIARYNTRSLGRATTGSEYDLVDLNNLATQMSEKYASQASAIQSVLDKMIIYSANNTTECCGLSLYYPYFNKKYYTSSWKEGYSALGLFDSYQTYLGRFEQIWLGTDMQEFFSDPMTPEEFSPGTYSLHLNEDQQKHYLSSGFYILRRYGEGIYSAISYSNDVTYEDGVITANYDGRTLVASDDYGTSFPVASTITDHIGNNYYHTISNIAKDYYFSNTYTLEYSHRVNSEIQLVVDHDTSQVSVSGYYLLDESDTKADAVKSGKKIPLPSNIFKVLTLSSNVPRYPVRDNNGVLLPFEQWTDSGLTLSNSLSFENGIHFTYEPFYENGSEYFIMFDIIDTQDNHYSSEFMPVALASAPEESAAAPAEPATEIVWDDGPLSPAVSESGISFQFYESNNPFYNDSINYGLYITNNTNSIIVFSLGSIILNEQYQLNLANSSVDVPAHKSFSLNLRQFAQQLMYAGISNPETLQFTYTIQDYYSGKYLAKDKAIKYSLSENIRPHTISTPVLGTTVHSQSLYDDQNLSIDIVDMGNYVSMQNTNNDSLSGRLLINNKADEDFEIKLDGYEINGLYFSINNTAILKAKRQTYMLIDSSYTNYPFKSIYSLNLIFSGKNFDNGSLTVPVELDGNSTKLDTGYDENSIPLYEDDYFVIYDGGAGNNYYYSDQPTSRTFIVKNKTGKKITFDLYSVSDSDSSEPLKSMMVRGVNDYAPYSTSYIWFNLEDFKKSSNRFKLGVSIKDDVIEKSEVNGHEFETVFENKTILTYNTSVIEANPWE